MPVSVLQRVPINGGPLKTGTAEGPLAAHSGDVCHQAGHADSNRKNTAVRGSNEVAFHSSAAKSG